MSSDEDRHSKNGISQLIVRLFSTFERIDHRVIYLLVAVALSFPLIFKTTLPPAEMDTASNYHRVLDSLNPNERKIVIIAADWGPGTSAENKPQTEATIEHLMRRRIPFALVSIYSQSEPFLRSVPREVATKLEKQFPDERWLYGQDWVNLGFQPGGFTFIESLAKAEDFHSQLNTDAQGTPLEEIPCMKDIKSIKDVALLVEVTGLAGAFNYWIQFFQGSGYRPPMVHGCTSISIPEAYIYYSSGQIVGLLEGIAGAAWYDKLLSEAFPQREVGTALLVNTGVSFAQLIIIAFIFVGNVGLFFTWLASRQGGA